MNSPKILRIDSSSSTASSASRHVCDLIVAHLAPSHLVLRDVASQPLPVVDVDWVTGRMKPPADRSEVEAAALSLSDSLVAEVLDADVLVIGVPIYNFGISAALKAWIDLIVRPGLTFQFTATGVQPLVHGKRVILAVASASTAIGGETDFATRYLRTILGFIGMTEVEVVAADLLAFDRAGVLARAESQVATLRH